MVAMAILHQRASGGRCSALRPPRRRAITSELKGYLQFLIHSTVLLVMLLHYTSLHLVLEIERFTFYGGSRLTTLGNRPI